MSKSDQTTEIAKAIARAGSAKALGALINRSQQAVSKYHVRGWCPDEVAMAIALLYPDLLIDGLRRTS